MLKKRVIPVLTTNGFGLVKTKQFQNPRMLGNPIQTAKVFNNRDVDELIFVDIYATRDNREVNLINAQKVIDECFMPVGIGGGIKSLKQIEDLLKIGADKVIISTAFLHDLDFVKKAIEVFGSQCVTIAVDVVRCGDDYVHVRDNSKSLSELIRVANTIQVGEIILTSVDTEGTMLGYDDNLYRRFLPHIDCPVIVNGGAGRPEHVTQLQNHEFISGYAAASIFAYTQYTPHDIKMALFQHGLKVRI